MPMDSQVLCVAYSPDGRRLAASCGNSGTPGYVQQWDAATCQPVAKRIERHQYLQSVSYSPDGRRLLIASNEGKALDLHRDDEASTAYETLVKLPDATGDDFCAFGKFLVRHNCGKEALPIFDQAIEKFPAFPRMLRMKGWALIDMNAFAEALEMFKRYDIAVPLVGESPDGDGIAGLALSRWMTHDQPGAVNDCVRLIGMNADYRDAAKAKNSDWTDTSKKNFLALLAETLRLHPELVKAN